MIPVCVPALPWRDPTAFTPDARHAHLHSGAGGECEALRETSFLHQLIRLLGFSNNNAADSRWSFGMPFGLVLRVLIP